MTKTLPLPDRGLLLDMFSYDMDTGLLFWVRRPSVRSRKRAGDEAGTLHHSGYVQVGLSDALYLAHRLVWKMQTGVDPIEVDHRNGVRNDNRWANLREATSSQNKANRVSVNFHKGVHFIARDNKYGAQIKAGKKHTWLGSHATPEAACAAYRAAAKNLHGDFAKPGSCACR